MATPNRQSKPYTYRTEQEIANNTYDEQYKVETVAPLGYRTDIDSFVPLNIDASGNLNVTSTGGGGGGTQYTDGSTTVTHPIGSIPVYDKSGTITAVSVANPLPVSATISTAGLATSTIQTDGTQKTQVTSLPSIPAGSNSIGTVINGAGSASIGTVGLNAGSNTIGNTGTPSATINIGQTTSAVTAVQLSSSSIAMTNGVVVQALSTNTASVFIGNSSVTTANGFELTAGSSLTISPSNINLVYVIGSNATDKVCWSVT